MPIGDEPDVTRSVSSTDQAVTTRDAGETKPDTATVAPTESKPSTSTAPATAPPAANGAPPATKPTGTVPDDDPVRAAIARLARDTDQPRDEQGRFTAAERAAAAIAKAAGGKKPTPAPAPTAPAAAAKPAAAPVTPDSPTGVDTDPYHGFDERERAAFKGKTRERVEELHRRWRESETARAALAETAQQPDEFTELVQKHKLTEDVGFVPEDHLAGLVRAQAALVRSQIALGQGRNPHPNDLKAAQSFFGRIDAVREQLGLKPAAPTAPELKPFVGELPADAKDLVEVYGLPEADVRLLVALKARKAVAATTGATAPPPASSPTPLPPSPSQRPTGIDLDALYGQRLIADVTRDGVQPEMVQAHFQVLLPIAAKITQSRFPGLPADRVPAVFDALPPQERYNIMLEAQKTHRANSAPPVRPSNPLPAATHPSLTGSPPRRAAASASGDPVADAVAFLAR